MKYFLTFFVIAGAIILVLFLWRMAAERKVLNSWKQLEDSAPVSATVVMPDKIKDLPPNVRRFFEFTISPGAKLQTTTKIKMRGQLGLGPKSDPGYMDMDAVQILRFPDGFIWKVRTGDKPIMIKGSDGLESDHSWSRFWVGGMIPAVQVKGDRVSDKDHYRAAFGRMAAEAALWNPAALLQSEYVRWQDVADNHIRAAIDYEGVSQTVDLFLDDRGAPVKVTIARWSDANDTNTYQLQPFGGYVSEFKEFEGYRVPTHVEVGNFIDTENYFPFFIADITELDFTD